MDWKLELVQVREIPAGKGCVDRLGELGKGVARADDEDPARWRAALSSSPAEQFNLDLEPRPRHG